MRPLKPLSLTSAVHHWLANSQRPRLLHIFDKACNLINEQREVVSIVTPHIGNGPFNLVIEDEILFSEHLDIKSVISISDNQLGIGALSISTASAKLWDPRPDWELLHTRKDTIATQISKLPITSYQFSHSLISTLSTALANADISTTKEIASKLAGLGSGLTPSGDDFLMGAMHAVWIIHPGDTAFPLTSAIAETAAPLTTSLSMAWIKSAGRGETGELWHNFFDALINGNEMNIRTSYEKILSVGETSGADALAGFISIVDCWMKRQ